MIPQAESHSLTGVTATVTLTQSGGEITGITINDQGTLYDGNSLPSITIDEAGQTTHATLTVFCGRSISSISIGSRGSGYTSAPTVTVSASPSDSTGSGAQATSTIGFPINAVNITNVGAGYNFEPTILITGGNPVNDAVLAPKFSKRNARLN